MAGVVRTKFIDNLPLTEIPKGQTQTITLLIAC